MSVIRIPVTQEHIDRGKQSDPKDCPIYHALKAWDWEWQPAVGGDRILLKYRGEPGIWREAQWPFDPDLLGWVATFDDGDAVKPFDLLLDDAAGLARLGRDWTAKASKALPA